MNLSSPRKYRSDYQISDFQIPETHLLFQIFDGYTIVSSSLQIMRTRSDAQSLILDGKNLELLSVSVNGTKIDSLGYALSETQLTLPWVYGDMAQIEIQNTIYPEKNTELEGLYFASGFYCTQNEPLGFRHITYFLDRPDVMSVFSVRIEASKQYPLLLSNGNKMASGELDNNRHFVEWHDPFKKPTYLFALVGADLEEIHDTFITRSGRSVDLYVYVDHGKGDDAQWAMQSLKRAMKWDEDRYGREYDLDIFHIVATESFNMGAMENKSLNIFNTIYIRANPRTSTDRDFMDVEAVIGHEYFHNWTGNRITCRDWFQLTLKEGLTVFRDQNFSADMHSSLNQRISDIEYLREVQFPEDQGKTAHPIQPDSFIEMNNFYTATVYDKGAEVIRMVESMVGRDRFRMGMDVYFDRHDGQAVTTHDFIQAISDGAGIDLSEFESCWYHQSRTPILIVETQYSGENQTFTLKIKQKPQISPEGGELQSWYIPLFIALFDPETKKEIPLFLQEIEHQTLLDQNALIISEKEHIFHFNHVERDPKISLNRGYRAPIRIESHDIDLAFLSRYESDGISRYDAWKQYSITTFRLFLETEKIDSLYLETYISLLQETVEDELFTSLLLAFPSDSTLLSNFAPMNPQLLSEKRTDFLIQIGKNPQISAILSDKYNTCIQYFDDSTHRFDDTSIKKRAYISMIAGLITDFGIKMNHLGKKLLQSNKMTLNLAFWRAQLQIDPENGIVALKNWMQENGFYGDLLMRMKYFSLLSQASSKNLGHHIEAEVSGSYFDITIPNLVRSLIGSVVRNFQFFHTEEGYAFYAKYIIKVDAVNPQIASRLSKAFTVYELIDSSSQKKMKKEIDLLLSHDTLSSGVREILEKVIS